MDDSEVENYDDVIEVEVEEPELVEHGEYEEIIEEEQVEYYEEEIILEAVEEPEFQIKEPVVTNDIVKSGENGNTTWTIDSEGLLSIVAKVNTDGKWMEIQVAFSPTLQMIKN